MSLLDLFRHPRDVHGRRRRGSRSQTYSGQEFWVLDPRADEVHFDDVCIGIARECRYGNQSREYYSVAEHSVIVSVFVENFARDLGWSDDLVLQVAREGLLHDGSEAYLGDVMRPLKHQRVMRGYRCAESRLQDVIFEHFDVHPTIDTTWLVDIVDKRACVDEVEALMLDPAFYKHDELEPLGADIAALSWERAARVWSRRFSNLFPDYLYRRAA